MAIDHPQRLRAGRISVATSLVVLGGKWLAFGVTGSVAILSDAAESIVNVLAAGLLLVSLMFAARPADSDHPYGHGKIELFTAGFEGALILVAAVMIAVQAVRSAFAGVVPQALPAGIGLLVAASCVNAGLGWYLLRTGARTGSLALEADGRHVLADVWTSVGVVAGLVLVRLTGWAWLDPLTALMVAAFILREGVRLGRRSFDGLMDAADDGLLRQLTGWLDAARPPEWIDVHGLRAWRSGAELHADLHLVVPRYLDVEQLHRVHDEIERTLLPAMSGAGDVVVHFDPCVPHNCEGCMMSSCPVREAAYRERPLLTPEWATRPDLEANEAHA